MSHGLCLVMLWANAPAPPDRNVEVFALGGAWGVAKKLPVNIEIRGARGELNSVAGSKKHVVRKSCDWRTGNIYDFHRQPVLIVGAFRYGVARGDDEEKNRRTTTALDQMIAKQQCRQSRCRLFVMMALRRTCVLEATSVV